MQSFIMAGTKIIRHMAVAAVGLLTIFKFGSLTVVALSMLISVAFYAMAFGLKFAIGFVLLLFLHEIGHILASNVVGVKISGPVFVPFLGAVVNLRQNPVNARMEANIAIGGPAVGTLSALFCLAGYFWTDSMLFMVLAYTACLLNLFNLVPCAPLDGWRIACAISPHLWWLGVIVLGGFACYTQNIFIWMILIFSLTRFFQGEDWETRQGNYFTLTIGQRFTVACWYFSLIVVLGVITVFLAQIIH